MGGFCSRERWKKEGEEWASVEVPASARGASVWGLQEPLCGSDTWDLIALGPEHWTSMNLVDKLEVSGSESGSLCATALLCVLKPLTDSLWLQFPHKCSLRILQMQKQVLQLGLQRELSPGD